MTARDHFLETFERRRRGAAARDELTELERHAQACPSCALELSLMNDLAVRHAATDADFFGDERAVAMALRQLPALRAKSRRFGWILAVSALLVAGAAAAAGGVLLKRGERGRGAEPPLPTTRSAENAAHGPAISATSLPAPLVAPVEPAAQSAAETPAASAEAAKASRGELESAAQLFAKANQLRRQGKDALATDAYRDLERRFAGSAEARQAMVTLGWLLLDRSRSGEALQQFELYLNRGGAASEDALAGLALAQQRLGKSGDERRTLAALVSRYPTSANAARAKKRLAELD